MENAENFEGFKRFLRNKEVYFEENTDDESRVIILRQSIANSTELTIVVDFSNNSTLVNVYVGDIAHIDSPLKREELLKLVNEMNMTYTFMKLVALDDGVVRAKISLFVHDETDYEDLFLAIIITIKNIEDEVYKKFMRLQWA